MSQRSLFKSLSWGTSSYMPWEVGDIFGFGCQTLIGWPQYTSANGPNIASAPELDPWRDPLCSWSVHSFWPAPLPARRSSPGSLQQMLCPFWPSPSGQLLPVLSVLSAFHMCRSDTFHFSSIPLSLLLTNMPWELEVEELSLQGYDPASLCLLRMFLTCAHTAFPAWFC